MSQDSEYTAKNLLAGVKELRTRQRPGIVMTPDISDADFYLNTVESLQFIAGYVSTLIDRIDTLEREVAELRR